MSLDDRTNETIQLAMNDGEIYVDVDSDSSIWPEPWVWIADQYDEDRPALQLTLEEAGKLHDRLGLILGRVQQTAVERAFDQLHWGCNNDDHRQAYGELAIALGYRQGVPQ